MERDRAGLQPAGGAFEVAEVEIRLLELGSCQSVGKASGFDLPD